MLFPTTLTTLVAQDQNFSCINEKYKEEKHVQKSHGSCILLQFLGGNTIFFTYTPKLLHCDLLSGVLN